VTPRVPAASAAVGSGTATTACTGLLGVLVPLIYDVYFSAILSGIAEGAYQHELRPVLLPTQHEHARELSLLDRLLRDVVDGALLVLPEASSDELKRAQVEGPPFVVIDPLLPLDVGLPCVTVANRSGAEQAMRHLLTLGHRRIAAITGPPGWVATEGRRSGYRAVLEGAGILFEPALEVEADFQIGPGAEAAASLLDLPEPPTAIFAFNDAIAVGAMHAARDRGLRLPEDLSIVGFDDVTVATIVAPALTTVRQPLAEMGRTAVNLLVRLLDGRHGGTQQIELPTRLVVRQSTAPRRDSPPAGR
jgi:LacI family transcriptional regulator, galactose operon repressor